MLGSEFLFPLGCTMFTCTLSFSELHESTSQNQVLHEVRVALGHGVLSTVIEFLELSQKRADRVSFLRSYKYTKYSQSQGSSLNHDSHKNVSWNKPNWGNERFL